VEITKLSTSVVIPTEAVKVPNPVLTPYFSTWSGVNGDDVPIPKLPLDAINDNFDGDTLSVNAVPVFAFVNIKYCGVVVALSSPSVISDPPRLPIEDQTTLDPKIILN